MYSIPEEILENVADQLPFIDDVRQFRLVSKRFALAGFRRLLRHIHIIDTADCYRRIEDLQASPYGSLRSTKELTIYYGNWPKITSQEEWLRHPLSIGAQRSQVSPSDNVSRAFLEYQQFIHQENSRDHSSNAACFSHLLALVPNVSKVSISHIHSWRWGTLTSPYYQSLTNNIWMIPFFECSIHHITSRLWDVLSNFTHIKEISLNGQLHLAEYVPEHLCNHVTHLSIESLMADQSLKPKLIQFLMSFPTLEQLELSVVPTAAFEEPILPLEGLNWPNLQHVSFKGMASSGEALIDFVLRHRLDSISIQKTELVDGSWETFFTRLRQRPGGARVGALGSDLFLTCDRAIYELLHKFLATKDFPWPFQTWTQLNSDFLIQLR